MVPADVLSIGRDLVLTALLVAAPAVMTSLAIGLLISILQTLTSIQEQTLSFVPRIVGVSVVLILTLPWMLRILINFSIRMLMLASEAGQ